MVLHAGTNNLPNEPPEKVIGRFDQLINEIRYRAPHITVYVSAILPRDVSVFPGARNDLTFLDRCNERAEIVNRELRSRRDIHFIEHKRFGSDRRSANRCLISRDGLHLTPEGIRELKMNIEAAVQFSSTLKKPMPSRKPPVSKSSVLGDTSLSFSADSSVTDIKKGVREPEHPLLGTSKRESAIETPSIFSDSDFPPLPHISLSSHTSLDRRVDSVSMSASKGDLQSESPFTDTKKTKSSVRSSLDRRVDSVSMSVSKGDLQSESPFTDTMKTKPSVRSSLDRIVDSVSMSASKGDLQSESPFTDTKKTKSSVRSSLDRRVDSVSMSVSKGDLQSESPFTDTKKTKSSVRSSLDRRVDSVSMSVSKGDLQSESPFTDTKKTKSSVRSSLDRRVDSVSMNASKGDLQSESPFTDTKKTKSSVRSSLDRRVDSVSMSVSKGDLRSESYFN